MFYIGSLSGRLRAIALIAVASCSLGLATSTRAAAQTPPAGAVTLNQCLNDLYDDYGTAAATNTSVPPTVASAFSVFDNVTTPVDTFSETPSLAHALGLGGAASYDPDSLELLSTNGSGADVYLVAATIRPVTVPAGCSRFRAMRDDQAFLALRQHTFGSGPGVCAVSVSQGYATQFDCESIATLESYWGALSLNANFGSDVTEMDVVPDGLATVQLTYASGSPLTKAVAANLIASPPDEWYSTRSSLSALEAAVAKSTPETVTGLNSAGQQVVSYARPANAVALYARADAYLNRAGRGG